ncbi:MULTISPECIES: thioredoxin domain-containing protein [unclassified Arthrobacter]|uniref:thioredoxin domain-containing protein n=1 Tax=unclassified Arthrobacter TaxID=235627 RepID=UPI001E3EC645|nr:MULTISPECIES: thioredoxin domain-containing protein [unclassified Arthrobacter]MCC9146092.1 thioredoxin domain-containing protein [Arthrobacter sp. zg-Y919]MDK1277321.1 thioredoxin domain-containing protein [Arthrobacter sp. zg.Y919]WIB03823.1 thioredoxin domain-containing protein [Arthrobacter sp. zg-Y919]
MAERLRKQASAYLRQHADNPVDWWPFGEEAFAEARRRNVPVFISVGYAACHWCHVMAHESFEDAATAQYLNEFFVSVKVDREERPDVDAVYMAATQALTGQGGWPMSVFTLPDGRTFYAGTYFPPRQLQGMPSFRQVLEAVSSAWRDRPEEVEASAAQIAAHLASAQAGNRRLVGTLELAPGGSGPLSGEVLATAVETVAEQEDPRFGGLGGAPKFPPSPLLRFLLEYGSTGRPAAGTAAAVADRTMETMARSGLYDQLEGGFARYTVDRAWAVPHFEKMLYDNAQLLRLYAHWSRSAPTGDQRNLALQVSTDTAAWLAKRLRVDGGGFASSLDADTLVDGQRREGATYVWTSDELRSVLAGAGPDTDAVLALLDLDTGRMEDGASTLHFGRSLAPEEDQLWQRYRPDLLAARDRRPQPDRDDKVVAGWNGLAIAGLADAAVALADAGSVQAAGLLDLAREAAAYLLRVHYRDGILARVSHNGRASGIEGLLEDYAGTAEGLFALFAATGEEKWYLAAEELVLAAEQRFISEGTLQDTAVRTDQLAAAQGSLSAADPMDGPTPSGTALFAGVLVTYAAYSGSSRHRALAEALLSHVQLVAARAPRAGGWAMSVLTQALEGPLELAVTGSDPVLVEQLLRAGRSAGGPGVVVARGPGTQTQVPLLRGRTAPDGGALAYLCRGMVCSRPAADPQELVEQFRGLRS